MAKTIKKKPVFRKTRKAMINLKILYFRGQVIEINKLIKIAKRKDPSGKGELLEHLQNAKKLILQDITGLKAKKNALRG